MTPVGRAYRQQRATYNVHIHPKEDTMSLFSWLKADDTNLYDEYPPVVDVNSHVPSLHVVVRIEATGMAGVLGNGYVTDHFHGPYYVQITDNGDLGVWEVGADLDPVAYYPAGNFHSVTTYAEDEWDAMNDEDELDEEYVTND